ncbi:MAG: hypothetical protein OEW00_08775 [candidate division Zixibacteria bacterium]|nr:hypothetical protein [candidate division Zixibacteria bacterium]
MKKLTLLLFLIMAGHSLALAQSWPDMAYPDTITITSLPYTCNQGYTVYMLSGNLSSNDGGIRIYDRDYIKIAGRGDTITFDTDHSGGVVGIEISGGSDHIVVESLTVNQFRTSSPVLYGSYGGSDATGIMLGRTEYVKLLHCNVHSTGHSSRGVDGESGGRDKQGIEVYGGNYTNFSNSFNGRMSNEVAAIWMGETVCKYSPETYHSYIHNVTVDSSAHACILIGGIAIVEHNKVTVDAHNERPDVSWANAHAIADAGFAWPGSRFNHNIIRSGTNHYGGRGMYFNFAAGTPDNVVEMAYNDIRMTCGYSGDGENPAARGVRIRWGCFNLRIHHNYIELSADDDPATQYRSDEAHGIWFGAIGEENSDISSFNEIYNNTVKVMWYGADNTAKRVTPLVVEQIRDPNQPFGNGNVSYYNRFISNFRVIQMGEVNEGCDEWLSYRDTIEYVSPHYRGGYGFLGAVGVGAAGYTCTDNRLVDPVFINTGTDSDALTNRSGGGTKSINVRRTLAAAVEGNNGLPVTGASVCIWPRQSVADSSRIDRAVVNKLTGTGGLVIDTLSYIFKQWIGPSLTSDSVYNDYRICVSKNADTNWSAFTVSEVNTDGGEWGFISDTLPLANTVGDGEWGAIDVNIWVGNSSQTEGGNLRFIVRTDQTVDQDVTYSYTTQNGSAQAPADFVAMSGIGTINAGRSADTILVPTVDDAYYEGAESMSFFISNPSQGTIIGNTAVGTINDNDDADNIPPAAPELHSPTQGSVIRSNPPILSVLNGSDPNNDMLSYSFELYDSAGASLIASADGITEGSSYTTWDVPVTLGDNTTYSWRARCFDGDVHSAWMNFARFTVDAGSLVNNPPTLPIHASPEDGDIVVSTPVMLKVDNSLDSDGDGITYDFYLYGDADLTQLLERHLDVVESPYQTSVVLKFLPSDGETYWWRVRAGDGLTTTPLTATTSFRFNSLYTSSEDDIPETVQPSEGEVVYIAQPVFAARNIDLAGLNDYYFQLAVDDNFDQIIEESGPISEQDGGLTRWQVPEELDLDRTYYWRVRANNDAYSAASSFAVAFRIIAYPNPVSFLQGETVTFLLPEEPTDVLIQTVSGETVLLRRDVSGEWNWDGRNASGNIVSVGVYPWFAREGAASGKIVVKP